MYKKCRSELQNCGKNQPYRNILEEGFAMQIIMDCRTTMTQEQSILPKIVTIFAVEEIILQQNVLGYRTDVHFPKYKLAIEIDEEGNNDRDND